MDSQRITRSFPEDTATQTLFESASEPADNGVDEFELGTVGSATKALTPEYKD
jgi:hypothetical protein